MTDMNDLFDQISDEWDRRREKRGEAMARAQVHQVAGRLMLAIKAPATDERQVFVWRGGGSWKEVHDTSVKEVEAAPVVPRSVLRDLGARPYARWGNGSWEDGG